MYWKTIRALCVFNLLFIGFHVHAASAQDLGIFAGQSDIGNVNLPGTAHYDPTSGAYTLSSAGADLWSTTDDFHFVWKKVTGDGAISADIDFPVKSGTHHRSRKAILMFRQTLDAGSAYVDAAQHGSGMAALQFRATKNDTTGSIELAVDAPGRIRLEKRGDAFTLFVSLHGEPLHPSGAAIKVHLKEPFYAGIGVCAHNPQAAETATFAHLEYEQLPPPTQSGVAVYSAVQAITIDPTARHATVVYAARARAQAPNWSRDGSSLLFNQDGHLYSVATSGKEAPQLIDTGSATDCSGSHGFSPDGIWLAISCSMPGMTGRHLAIIPAAGGTPRLLGANVSYFHSWSPDGKTILYTRGDHGSNNIYSISVDGGPETAITTGTGISDDPDYSPDGQYVYFNTDRWGGMQIARMHPDGSHVEQVTFDQFKNWTPHPSPDGKSIVFLSYNPEVTTHANDQDITLRILSPADNKIRILTTLVGGNGSMNVANWSPDSKRLAFVGYLLLPSDPSGTAK
ncbi:MAG TPA: hypothetical protein VFB43_12180 [Terracidiphilus sp.]|nr:hypothetical protein [Terracidiphilus sp.]